MGDGKIAKSRGQTYLTCYEDRCVCAYWNCFSAKEHVNCWPGMSRVLPPDYGPQNTKSERAILLQSGSWPKSRVRKQVFLQFTSDGRHVSRPVQQVLCGMLEYDNPADLEEVSWQIKFVNWRALICQLTNMICQLTNMVLSIDKPWVVNWQICFVSLHSIYLRLLYDTFAWRCSSIAISHDVCIMDVSSLIAPWIRRLTGWARIC